MIVRDIGEDRTGEPDTGNAVLMYGMAAAFHKNMTATLVPHLV
jgi:hypothetical protein